MIPITFKEVYTCNVRTYDISLDWSLDQLYTNLSERIRDDFHINVNELELVDTDISYVRYPGVKVEDYPPLPRSNILMLCDIWNADQLKYLAMYVRKVHLSESECCVCLNMQCLAPRYGCNHGICDNCYRRCLDANHIICPLCRQP
jgi:hypothetical protein